ncbi:FG-GAP-like repeat-containing protein [Winogradskyella sp. 3972H.M.0a.05]|uniref:T9SS type A sorting domain-containing protein n=1 Tax=Winogradskyella sp. 3972H.M.0a.05 TaxID=2950277 RepID=UPI0033926F55
MKLRLLTLFTIVVYSFSATSQTTFAAGVNIDPNVGADPYAINSADLDGDTFIDIVIGTYNFSSDFIRWYKNDGLGNFTQQTVISNDAGLQGIGGLAIADLDGINGNDIIAGSYSGKVVWFANDGMGGFGAEQLIGNLLGAGQVTTADINNDGHLDVVGVGFDANKVVWYAGDSAGNFGSEQIIEDTANFPGLVTQPGNVSFTDLDGDTDLDALIGYVDTTTDGTIEVFYNQYIESGTMTVSWLKDANTVTSGDPFLFVAAFADVNDDMVTDIIKCDNVSGEVAWYNKEMDGTYTETGISDDTIIDRPAVVKVSDLDNDGYNDVVLTDGGTADDSIIWFESTNSGGFNTEALIADNNHQVFAFTIADFDGDTDKDIATVGFGSDTLDWYENELFTLGIDDLESETISMFPNPSKGMVYFKGIDTLMEINVYSILGERILSASVNESSPLDISNLASGVYMIQFEGSNASQRLVKQ